MMQKPCKMIETLEHGYSSENTQRELSNDYQHDRVSKVFKIFASLCLGKKLASALEGLMIVKTNSSIQAYHKFVTFLLKE